MRFAATLATARTLARATTRAPLRRLCAGTPSTVLWHNAKCSKSRAALALLQARGEPFSVREYLEQPPSFAELLVLKRQLGEPPIEWVRTNDDAWAEYFPGVTIYDDLLPDDDDILRGVEKLPIMLERPILTHGDRAVVGRPPDRISQLLDGTLPPPPSGFSPFSAAAAASPAEDPIETIARLKKLVDAGALTPEEFEQKKTELLRRV